MTAGLAGGPVGVVRTTAGDVTPADLGRIDYHEHLFQVSPLLPGDELCDEAASTAEAGLLRASGFDSMVDATPIGLGRDPLALARAAATSGLRVVATTGVHRSEHYAGQGQAWVTELDETLLAARFLADVTTGMPVADRPDSTGPTGVRAGLLKVGIGYWSIDALARRGVAAVADVHRRTGAPVMVHTELATATHEMLDLLGGLGVAADRVVLAHVDRNPDPGLHAELAARGAYLGYDGPARARSAPDSALLACLAEVARRGHVERVVLGGDVARAGRYASYGGMPGLAYLGSRFVPRLVAEVGEEVTDTVLRANPQRWLTFRPV